MAERSVPVNPNWTARPKSALRSFSSPPLTLRVSPDNVLGSSTKPKMRPKSSTKSFYTLAPSNQGQRHRSTIKVCGVSLQVDTFITAIPIAVEDTVMTAEVDTVVHLLVDKTRSSYTLRLLHGVGSVLAITDLSHHVTLFLLHGVP